MVWIPGFLLGASNLLLLGLSCLLLGENTSSEGEKAGNYLQHLITVPSHLLLHPTILDKTVEKIVYLDNIFLNNVAVPVLPSPPSPESNVVVYSKESLIPGRLWEATLN